MARQPTKPRKLRDRPLAIEPLTLRVGHAAQALGIGERTAWQWIRDRKLEVVRPSTGVTLVLVSSIKRLLSELA
jgi:hypothetical protein